MRLPRHEIAEHFSRRWAATNTTPWGEIQNDEIEHAKARVLAPFLGPARSVLDLACGGGDFFSHLVWPLKPFETVVGVDIAGRAVDRARRTGRYDQLVVCDIDDASVHVKRRFDLVLLGEVLYYLKDYLSTLATASDFVAPGGVFFLSLAMGRGFFDRVDLAIVRSFLSGRRFDLLREERLDYSFLGIPRRYLCFHAQTHKYVLIYRASESTVHGA